ncbi:membrane protease subunit stomatin/prohibitin-like protein, partial [Azospirillum formosense]|nr:membrane protease subunit stomatin/prohibitin-like protein [Azospirillum formosense]
GAATVTRPRGLPVPPAAQLPSLSGEGPPGQVPVAQMPSLTHAGAEAAPAAAGHAPAAPVPGVKPQPAGAAPGTAGGLAKDGKAASAPILSNMSPSRLLDLIQSK